MHIDSQFIFLLVAVVAGIVTLLGGARIRRLCIGGSCGQGLRGQTGLVPFRYLVNLGEHSSP